MEAFTDTLPIVCNALNNTFFKWVLVINIYHQFMTKYYYVKHTAKLGGGDYDPTVD